MIEIIKAKGLNISKRSHLKVLFKELYSFFHSFGELRKTACPSFLSVMKEIENEETKKANTIENKEPNIYREDDFLLENFNDLVDLIEPQSYDKEIHEKELIRLIKELETKRKEEMQFINEQKNKEKLILNDESSHDEFIKSCNLISDISTSDKLYFFTILHCSSARKRNMLPMIDTLEHKNALSMPFLTHSER